MNLAWTCFVCSWKSPENSFPFVTNFTLQLLFVCFELTLGSSQRVLRGTVSLTCRSRLPVDRVKVTLMFVKGLSTTLSKLIRILAKNVPGFLSTQRSSHRRLSSRFGSNLWISHISDRFISIELVQISLYRLGCRSNTYPHTVTRSLEAWLIANCVWIGTPKRIPIGSQILFKKTGQGFVLFCSIKSPYWFTPVHSSVIGGAYRGNSRSNIDVQILILLDLLLLNVWIFVCFHYLSVAIRRGAILKHIGLFGDESTWLCIDIVTWRLRLFFVGEQIWDTPRCWATSSLL